MSDLPAHAHAHTGGYWPSPLHTRLQGWGARMMNHYAQGAALGSSSNNGNPRSRRDTAAAMAASLDVSEFLLPSGGGAGPELGAPSFGEVKESMAKAGRTIVQKGKEAKEKFTAKPRALLKLINRVAYFVHFVFFIAAISLGATNNVKWGGQRLTRNTVLVGLKPPPGSTIPTTGVAEIGGCLAGSHYASSTEMSFRSGDADRCTDSTSGVVTFEITQYPIDAGWSLSIPVITVVFSGLSFLFQLSAEISGKFYSGESSGKFSEKGNTWNLYDYMFQDKISNDVDINERRNYIRFVEYSFSASIMMMAIALTVQINDIGLHACIFFLTWACMMMGIIAEFFHSKVDIPKHGRDTMWQLGFFTHLIGWVCIIPPWAIIIQAYIDFDKIAESGKSCASHPSVFSEDRPPMEPPENCEGLSGSPPPFVLYIIITQCVLFCSFGFVQAGQFWSKGDSRMNAEFAYIILSLTAKAILSGLIMANLFVGRS